MSKQSSPNTSISPAKSKPTPQVSLPNSRRSSTANAAASPVANSQAKPPKPPIDLSTLVGSQIRVQYGSGTDIKTHEGILWCLDQSAGCLVLESPAAASTSAHANKKDYRIVRSSLVRSVDVLSPALPDFSTNIKPVSLDRVKQNEVDGIEQDRKRQARLGKGVSKLAQATFDSLAKTLPALWIDQSILVMDDILVCPPSYDADSCRLREMRQSNGAPSGSAANARLERVRKVIQGERAKIMLQAT